MSLVMSDAKRQLLEALKFLDAKEGEFGLSDAET